MMRRIFIVLLSAVLFVGFSSCKKESANTPESTTPATTEQPAAPEQPAPPAEQPAAPEQAPEGNADAAATAPAGKSASDLLKEFEDYVVAYADANNNKAKDIKKYQELAKQSTEWVTKIGTINKADLKPAEVKKLEKLLNDLKNINKI